ncbi:MAG: 16S rRNA (adenine(1518)-N(6)/adenine(1519)-N(6))-dimethyltransferase RsmA [Acidimicrobiales bacterium]
MTTGDTNPAGRADPTRNRTPAGGGTASRPLNRTQVHDLLDRHDLAPSRALGQNFLCDPGTVDRIVRLAGVEPGDRVVEIGAGLGTLTRGLAAAGARVVAIEVDRYLLPALAETVHGLDVVVLAGDAREVDWSEVLDSFPAAPEPGAGPVGADRPWSVVANLPYNLATPLILDLLRDQPALDRWLVMVQREAGERLAAGPGSRTYGIPSVLASYWADVRLVGSGVRPELFLPRPKVASVLVELRRHHRRPPEGYAAVAELVRAGFGQRRKMVRRSLAGLLDVAAIEAAGVKPTARAEQLDLDAWVRLAAVARPSPEEPTG